MIRSLVAVAAATTLLVTAVPAAQAAVAGPAGRANCTKTVLPLPADSLTGGSQVRGADPSGRYILGESNREGRMHGQAVLWVDGVPRWLGPEPGGESFGYSVVKGGLVNGTTYGESTDHWIYSVKTNSYKILPPSKNFTITLLGPMNKGQDIIGNAWDDKLAHEVPFVWPAGSAQPKLLPIPKGTSLYAVDDISDEGSIIARLNKPDGTTTSYLWKSFNAQPTRIPGVNQKNVWARDLEGSWIGGGEIDNEDNVTGLIWTTHNTKIAQLEEGVIDLNSSRDAATAGAFGPFGRYPSMIIRNNGDKITFPDGTQLQHIFERGNQWTAGGYDVSSGTLEPTLYACS